MNNHSLIPDLIVVIYSICLFVLVVLWLQSGIDKITDRKGNLDWLKGHFSKSVFKSMVPGLLAIITLLEILSGLTALLGIVEVWVMHSFYLPLFSCGLSLLSLLCLFTGQRLAKDYPGASTLVTYMLYTGFVLLFTLGLLFIQVTTEISSRTIELPS